MTVAHTLNGPWQLLPIDTFRHGFYPLNDQAWIEHAVPAHWQQHPLLERYSGKMVYRTRFSDDNATTAPVGRRAWLRFNGVFYWLQPYFNGVDLGRREGYFFPHEYEVTPWVAEDNTLIVEVECPDERDKFEKRLITGVFSHWDCIDPATNPGGIWLPVEYLTTGPVRLKEVLLHTERVSTTVAELRFRAELDSVDERDVILRWTLTPKNFAGEVQVIELQRALAPGVQELAGLFTMRDPQLWWTHDLGHPSCYSVQLELIDGGAVSDVYTTTFGIRQFELRNWIAYLNGKRLFIKGNNYAPGDTRIATMTRAAFDRDLELARQCHMNLLRVHAHVEHPAFYEAADEAGMLIWQDFPLQWLYRRSVLPEAERQVRKMVRLLYNHPAVAIWCMHNEPLYNADTRDERITTFLRTYFSVFVWNWNRDVMDTQLKRVAEAEDRTRPVVRSSGEYAIPLWHRGTDTHFYFGWYLVYGHLPQFASVARWFPKNIRFVTEFGAQSFPNWESTTKFMAAEMTEVDWDKLIDRFMFQFNILAHWLDWEQLGSVEALIDATQDYQVQINRFYIDRLRYHKYRPTGGVVPFMFHDPNPGVLWSILDYWRVPKRSYYAMQQAFSPQYAFTLLDQEEHVVGTAVDLPIYVVNDDHREAPVELAVRLFSPDNEELASLSRMLTLPTDCMAMEIERLRLVPEMTGTYQLVIELHGCHDVVNEYPVIVRNLGEQRNNGSLRSHPLFTRKRSELVMR